MKAWLIDIIRVIDILSNIVFWFWSTYYATHALKSHTFPVLRLRWRLMYAAAVLGVLLIPSKATLEILIK